MELETKEKPRARIRRKDSLWRVEVRQAAHGTTEAVWLSLGGCGSFTLALRIWLAVVFQGASNGG
ncbi:hypothetical protein [Falsihalocynthiibacter sp. CO-5D18]|uniref:hypothetical protein n=1 Tax=Falsihalocynthiibacter sp. CO-5D18 TaxID=3240872 RepID=UPI0035109311